MEKGKASPRMCWGRGIVMGGGPLGWVLGGGVGRVGVLGVLGALGGWGR